MEEKKNIKAAIIIPVFNEEKALGKLFEELAPYKENYEIIFVDDSSQDNSPKLLSQSGYRLLTHQRNLGYGASLKTGISHSQADKIIIMDADGTYPSSAIPKIAELLDNNDIVIGARIGDRVKIPWIRKPVKLLLGKYAQLLSGSKIVDLNSGMMGFKRELFNQFKSILPSAYSFTTTITLCSLLSEKLIHHLPINYEKRIGKSKMHPLYDTFNFFITVFKVIMFFKPLRIVIPASLGLFFLGVAVFIYDSVVLGSLKHDTTILLFLIMSFQTFLLGILTEIIVASR